MCPLLQENASLFVHFRYILEHHFVLGTVAGDWQRWETERVLL